MVKQKRTYNVDNGLSLRRVFALLSQCCRYWAVVIHVDGRVKTGSLDIVTWVNGLWVVGVAL